MDNFTIPPQVTCLAKVFLLLFPWNILLLFYCVCWGESDMSCLTWHVQTCHVKHNMFVMTCHDTSWHASWHMSWHVIACHEHVTCPCNMIMFMNMLHGHVHVMNMSCQTCHDTTRPVMTRHVMTRHVMPSCHVKHVMLLFQHGKESKHLKLTFSHKLINYIN